MRYNRAVHRHVLLPETVRINDSASDAKNLTGTCKIPCYVCFLCLLNGTVCGTVCADELGMVDQPPSCEDVIKYYASAAKTNILVLHPLGSAQLLLWGYGRTKDAHVRRSGEVACTEGRLHSALWAALGFNQCLCIGGIQTPGEGGGSASGKMPIASDFKGTEMERIQTYSLRLGLCAKALRSPSEWQKLHADGTIRRVFPDWCQIQLQQASDYVSLARMVFKFSNARDNAFGSNSRMMYHMCGDESSAIAHMPYPTCRPSPPPSLWPRGRRPRWVKDVTDVETLRRWWKSARLKCEVKNLQ